MYCNAYAQQKIYKWVDAKGKTHYSEEEPHETQKSIEEIKVKPPTKQHSSVEDGDTIGSNKLWFDEQIKRREQSEVIKKQKQKAVLKRKQSLNQSQKKSCQSYRNSLVRYQNELKASKRAGIRVKTENWYKSKISSLEETLKTLC
jgi:hypothetical protein